MAAQLSGHAPASKLIAAIDVQHAFDDANLTEPILPVCVADTEVNRDLFEGDATLAASSDRDDILAGLLRTGTGQTMTFSPLTPPCVSDQSSRNRS